MACGDVGSPSVAVDAGGPGDSPVPSLMTDGGATDAGADLDGGSRDAGALDGGWGDGGSAVRPDPADYPGGTAIEAFAEGEGGGFGRNALPDVVLGPPQSLGPNSGSLDVVSLGAGGEIVLSFSPRRLVDGPGADLLIFENSFFVGGNPERPFAELGSVAVSVDGQQWHEWPCDAAVEGPPWPGCAGWRPTRAFDPDVLPWDPERCGGDPFDLAELGLSEARFVRIRDLQAGGAAPSRGFDLDAIGLIHFEEDAESN